MRRDLLFYRNAPPLVAEATSMSPRSCVAVPSSKQAGPPLRASFGILRLVEQVRVLPGGTIEKYKHPCSLKTCVWSRSDTCFPPNR
uniref:Uncharacterized protein n=1 Tax=Rubinisphaera brasiliensis (strain ATCC 49424 / DSM 5305 / JCM 21570 / IAM 15109 / NBRC 103401 / IFAM 1448) TaxID=756272 RepID=F0SQB4_RUBBR|nr:hypothetical protein Plabr_4722 [Rubinisphaera brasiliensis DSM 5305]